MKSTKVNKILEISLIFSVVSLSLVVFCIWPLFNDIKRNSGDLISAKNDMASLLEQINDTKIFQKNYQLYKPNLDKLDQLFLDPNNLVDFIEFLEDTAISSGITSKISLTTVSDKSQQFAIFQVTSEGSISKILDFTKKIEAGPYLVEIENLIFQYPSTAETSKKYVSNEGSTRFAIKTFIKK